MIKVYGFALIMYSMLTTTRRIQIALWVLGLCIGAWGAKGGWASLISLGAYKIHGPEGSIIGDNNDFAVVLVIKDIALFAWGAEDLVGPRAPGLSMAVEILDRRIPAYDLLLIAIGPLVLAAMWLLLTRTRWGALVRAATQDREMVGALGVDQAKLFRLPEGLIDRPREVGQPVHQHGHAFGCGPVLTEFIRSVLTDVDQVAALERFQRNDDDFLAAVTKCVCRRRGRLIFASKSDGRNTAYFPVFFETPSVTR